MKHFAWDYEDSRSETSPHGYYHIFAATDAADSLHADPITIRVPETKDNDAAITEIVSALDRIADAAPTASRP